jgi:hypothetical protein
MVAVLAIAMLTLMAAAVVVLRANDPETRVVTLPSGREIEVIQMGIDSPASRVWSLSYRTYLPMNQPHRIACEVALVWNDVQTEVERAGAARAILAPENFSTQIVFAGWRPAVISHVSTGYLFVKGETGEWVQRGPRCQE